MEGRLGRFIGIFFKKPFDHGTKIIVDKPSAPEEVEILARIASTGDPIKDTPIFQKALTDAIQHARVSDQPVNTQTGK